MPTISAPRRKTPVFRGPRSSSRPAGGKPEKVDHEILFQTYFKSVGPRTYAAQVKKATNDNHYLVLTEGKRDEKTGEVRKTRVFVYSEDFVAFFRMVQETAKFIRAHPVPEEVKQQQIKFWARKAAEGRKAGTAPVARQAIPSSNGKAPGRAAGATAVPAVPAAPPGPTRPPATATVARPVPPAVARQP